MENLKEKIITDKKVDYLVRTLSRTKRKDYENYVVNAIWNRLKDDSLEIVTQQYIYNPKKPKIDQNGKEKKHYFIDLYFPTLNIGIECDEAHHLGEENIEADKEREVSIFDALDEIGAEGYDPIHIDVTKTFEEVEKQINDAVDSIKKKKEEKKPPKWEVLDNAEYFSRKSEISIEDKIGFRTREEVCNILFSTGCDAGRSYFTPSVFKNTEYAGYKLWFPQLAVYDENGEPVAATKAGWINQLKNNGEEIIQEKDDAEPVSISEGDKIPRIVFAKYEDKLKDNGYKFVGIFVPQNDYKDGKSHYRRIEKKCKIRGNIKKNTDVL